MKSVITVNPRGTLTLPARIRRLMGLGPEHVLLAEMTPEGVLLRPSSVVPVETYTPARLREFAVEEAKLARRLGRRRKG